MTAVVEMRGVTFRYAERDGFELRVPELVLAPRDRVACIGASGCGKTTLVNLVSGVLRPDSGAVSLCGQELSAMSDAARRACRLRAVGMVFQEFELLDYLSALDNILLPFRIGGRGHAPAQAKERARTLAGSLGIEPLLGRKPRRLSQGERQRVSVCRALVTGPSIVIGDEPTGSLDPDNARAVIELLLDTAADAALLVVTHDHGLLGRFDRVIDLGASRKVSA